MNKHIKFATFITPVLLYISHLLVPASANADEFNCFQVGNCTPPALSDSQQCVEGTDYTISSVNIPNRNVVVLSIHGGKIELKTSNISNDLANLYNWNRYDFNGHGSSSCLDGLSQFKRLHITSSNFDDPQALGLVQSHPKSVSIHGYGDHRGYSNGTICVGGKNTAQRSAFIDYIANNQSTFSHYTLQGIDATQAQSGEVCEGL